jgi:hypothetical protein
LSCRCPHKRAAEQGAAHRTSGQLEDGLIAADETHVGRLRQARLGGSADFQLDLQPVFRLGKQLDESCFEHHRHCPILNLAPASDAQLLAGHRGRLARANPEASAAYRPAIYCAAVSTKTL